MAQKEQKLPPPTAAKDSGLASESKTKKAIPTWVKWLAGGAVGTSFLASGLVIGAIIHNNIMEEERKRNARIENEKEEAKKRKEAKVEEEEEEERKERERQEKEAREELERQEEAANKERERQEEAANKERERQEKAVKNRQIFLQNAKNFDDNISKIAIFLNNPIEELTKYIVAGTSDTFDEVAKKLAFSRGYLLVLENFKTYIGMYALGITNSKKQINRPVIGGSGKPKNKYEWVDDKNGFIIGSFEIKVLSDKKFALKHNGLGLIFESHDLQLQKV